MKYEKELSTRDFRLIDESIINLSNEIENLKKKLELIIQTLSKFGELK